MTNREDALVSERRPRIAGDAMPPHAEAIEVHVGELRQLFNAIDPAPFRRRDLAPEAEDFIVGWAREAHRDAPLALVVYLDRPDDLHEEALVLREAIRAFFTNRAQVTRLKLRQLFRVARASLLIGVTVLALFLLLGDFLARLIGDQRFGGLIRESLLIGGWVAMWKPMELFLYEWWPIRAEARLADRLAAMPVRIVSESASPVAYSTPPSGSVSP